MNKELKRCVETIKSLEAESGIKAAYINMFLTGTTSVHIEATTFDKWFNEYELEPDALYPKKTAPAQSTSSGAKNTSASMKKASSPQERTRKTPVRRGSC